MPQMTRIWERLYIGNRDDAERLYRSNPHQIRTVITLCEDWVLRRSLRLNWVHVPIRDAAPISGFQLNSFVSAMAKYLPQGKVLLHCQAGVSRSPIMAGTWLHLVGYKNIDAALREIAKLRDIIDPSDILLNSLREHLK